jgi:hypothetical protein
MGEQTFSSSEAKAGAYAKMNQWQPALSQNIDHSLAEIAVVNPISNGSDALEEGWIVAPSLFDDNGSHLFMFTTIGSQDTDSCWVLNENSCGWHQVSQTRKPGMRVTVTSNTEQYGI